MSKWKIQPVVEGLQQARHEWRERQHRIKEFGGRELPPGNILNPYWMTCVAFYFQCD